jgi:glucan phosphoethanolaminetransferase (alkaline phosphatase superfamily)
MAVVLVSGSAFCAIELYRFTTEPPTEQAEPVSMTFYPLEAARNLQGHAVDRLSAARLDAEADAARTAYRPNPSAQRLNLVLIVVDALRADHLGVYGYPRDTTPNLSQLERAGKLRKVGSMRAACSSSVCGLLSIMSSKFVHQLSYGPMTLQEALRRHGYRIHLVLSGDHTNFYGLKAAYGPVDSYVDGDSSHGRQYVNDDQLVLDHLEQFPDWDGNPVFIQFHLMSVHILGRRDGAAAKYRPAENYARLPLRALANARSERGVNYYDNGVLQTDAMIARLLFALERKGYLKQAVVAITADHGESLGEHGYYQHGNSVREEVLRVPFLLLSFGHQPARPLAQRALASQVDIAPTLLEELDMPRPQTWSGTPLQESGSADFAHFQELGEVGLYDHRDPRHLWKYWVDSQSGQEYAYNLSLDPKELRNAIGEATEQQKREWRTRVVPAKSMAVSARRPPR